VGISKVLKIKGHFLFEMGCPWDHFVWSGCTYHHMLLGTRNNNIYDLGVGISVVFKILGHFLFKGDGTTMYCHDLHTIRCKLIQETRIYMG
jgi:hypothetical protein